MQFEYSAVVDGTNCHIRATKNRRVSNAVATAPHKHYFMEFHCMFSGSETVYLPQNNQTITLRKGQILVIPGGVYHGITTESGTVERLCFNFSAEPGERADGHILELFRAMEEVLIFADPQASELARYCSRLDDEEALGRIRQGGLLLNVALELLSRTDRARELTVRDQSNSKKQKWVIEEYIEDHYTDDAGIEGLAKALYLSERQTRKLVRRFLGEDYKSIIIRRRMELADIYLQDPEKTLEEIAWQVGYRSYSGFQLSFKRFFGTTPSDRRRRLQEDCEKNRKEA